MGIQIDRLKPSFRTFIEEQDLFFVATAAPEGRVNLSPKGLETLKIINDTQIVWLSLTGSGNESAAHVLQDPRMTLMFCGFGEQMLILRVYGTAQVVHPRDPEWDALYNLFPDYAGARNIFKLNIELVTTSCGSGIPEMSVVRTRGETELVPFYAEMGTDGVEAFWQKKNTRSIDGAPTGIFDDAN